MSTCQKVANSNTSYVFTEGHGAGNWTDWFNDLGNLEKIDWSVVYERYWKDTDTDMDRQRRKQAAFLVYRFCDWSLLQEIGVINKTVKDHGTDIIA